MNEKGLHLLDLRTGVDSTLGVDGYSPVWSPDGSRILYAATPGLGVMEADGSESRPIDVGGAEITPPVGWLPDNETIIYSFMTGKGFGFVKRNLMTSELTELPLSVQNKWGYVSLSPDGQWVAFMDHVFGASSYGVFVSRVNGTDRRLIVAGDVPTSYRMSWSPNGEWLLVSTLDYQDPASPVPGYRPALIELTTCRAIVLADFGGDVEGWVR
jgi:Tol biopolymer transport system component